MARSIGKNTASAVPSEFSIWPGRVTPAASAPQT